MIESIWAALKRGVRSACPVGVLSNAYFVRHDEYGICQCHPVVTFHLAVK